MCCAKIIPARGIAVLLLAWSPVTLPAQTITDPVGDITAGDPTYLDLSQVRVRQLGDMIQVDFYPVAPIPEGNQVGISVSTVYEVYFDIDSNAATGVPFGDMGYDYKLRADLFQWNGKSWIDGNVYWDFDQQGNASHSDGFFIFAPGLIPQRFRWEFSLISLNWHRIDWAVRVYYRDHWTERVPDVGHGTLVVDTSPVSGIDTATTAFIRMIFPITYQAVLDSFQVLNTVDAGARIESGLCGTDFGTDLLVVKFNPWLNGVAYSGNPVQIGSWGWGAQPGWFIFFHELGHDFTLAATRFKKLYPSGGYVSAGGDDYHYGTDFVEAWATMVGLNSIHEMSLHPGQYGVNAAAQQNLAQQFTDTRTTYENALHSYEMIPDHSHLYPDLVDGIFLTLADSFGYDIFSKWFKILQPPNAPWARLDGINATLDYTAAKIISMTITACAFSVAAGVDLKDMFRTRWDFPVDNVLYDQIKPEIEQMINGPTAVEEPSGGQPLWFHSLGNYPNPFNASTNICFQLPKQTPVRMRLYNALGQLVRDSFFGNLQAGNHQIPYDAGGLSSGIYYYVLTTTHGRLTQKLVMVK